jgi:DNA repair exonuclease SbcCD ATPase subunit
MLNLEQAKQLEAKIAKAINYVERISREKSAMLQQEAELKSRLDAYQKQEAEMKAKLESYQGRIDELEVLVARFKDDQGKIEESILSALDRLSQFEKDMEKSLKDKGEAPAGADGGGPAGPAPKAAARQAEEKKAPEGHAAGAGGLLIDTPEREAPGGGENSDDSQEKGAELDIY